MNRKILSASLIFILCATARADKFVETIPVFGVVKPTEMTTAVAVNHGMVSKIHGDVGDKVAFGQTLLTVIEKETTRVYRTTINGRIAKLHVTRGATLTPGMPLVTVINPQMKQMEVSLSPNEAQSVKMGSEVFKKGSRKVYGHVSKVSPLVDPDSGAVLSYIKPEDKIEEVIGNVVSLEIAKRRIENCLIKPLEEIDKYIDEYRVEAVSGVKACLLPKK